MSLAYIDATVILSEAKNPDSRVTVSNRNNADVILSEAKNPDST